MSLICERSKNERKWGGDYSGLICGAGAVASEFTAKVNWDRDAVVDDGCNGTDLVFQDDPLELTFSQMSDGRLFVSTKTSVYNVDAAGQLNYNFSSKVLGTFPMYLFSCGYEGCHSWRPLDKGIYDCLLQSGNSLDQQQMAAVERFFAAVEYYFRSTYHQIHMDGFLVDW